LSYSDRCTAVRCARATACNLCNVVYSSYLRASIVTDEIMCMHACVVLARSYVPPASRAPLLTHLPPAPVETMARSGGYSEQSRYEAHMAAGEAVLCSQPSFASVQSVAWQSLQAPTPTPPGPPSPPKAKAPAAASVSQQPARRTLEVSFCALSSVSRSFTHSASSLRLRKCTRLKTLSAQSCRLR
jgi:hypothetical protein